MPASAVGARPDLGQDLARRPAQLPVVELEQQDADHVLVDVLIAERDAAAGVDRVDPGDAQDAVLDLAHQLVALARREIAAGVNLQPRHLGLDLREELDAAAEGAVGRVGADRDR